MHKMSKRTLSLFIVLTCITVLVIAGSKGFIFDTEMSMSHKISRIFIGTIIFTVGFLIAYFVEKRKNRKQ